MLRTLSPPHGTGGSLVLNGKTLTDATLPLLVGLTELETFSSNSSALTDDGFKQQIQDETGLKPEWAAEAFQDPDEDVRQSIRRIEASPFVTKHESLRGFVFDVATGRLNEVTA